MRIEKNQEYLKVIANEGYVLTYKEKAFNECVVPIDFDLTQIKEISK